MFSRCVPLRIAQFDLLDHALVHVLVESLAGLVSVGLDVRLSLRVGHGVPFRPQPVATAQCVKALVEPVVHAVGVVALDL